MFTFRIVLAGVVVLACARAEAQSTWYVDVQAMPPGNGLPGSPYASIQHAHDQATTVNGDTVLVAPGTYFENVTLTKSIVVRAIGGAEVTTLRPAAPGTILFLAGPSDQIDSITFEGFTITGLMGSFGSVAVGSGDGKLLRCIVRGNHGSTYYGVNTFYDTNLVDCTVVDNDIGVECSTLGEAIWMKNCIVWGNGTNYASFGQPILEDIRYCAGGPFPTAAGPGNLNVDPQMWDVASGDYHLRPGSPCIDAGDPSLPNDPDGSRSDIGYYTYSSIYAPITSYCAGKLNSDGCVPVIAGSGLPSSTATNPFLVSASLVLPGRRSVLIYSLAQAATPFQGATLCVASPIRRTGAQTSQGSGACGGTLAYDFNVRIQSGVDPALVPGVLVDTQWWYRDPLDPAGFGTGLSDGLSFGIAP